MKGSTITATTVKRKADGEEGGTATAPAKKSRAKKGTKGKTSADTGDIAEDAMVKPENEDA